MEDKITEKLFELEEEENIHIVNARQRGSRMLGVAHEDSDWDVLFLFAQDASKYATLDGYIDTFHRPHLGDNGEIDLHGWNISKFAKLAADSNPNAVEYCREDAKEYLTFYGGGTFDAVERDLRENFNHMALYYHYISMAKNNYMKYIESGKDCTKGRQFYVARAIAMAHYIRVEGELPPMNVNELTDSNVLSDQLEGVLRKLAKAKREGHGDDENPDIVEGLYEAESEAPMTTSEERINNPDREVIDRFITEAIVR